MTAFKGNTKLSNTPLESTAGTRQGGIVWLVWLGSGWQDKAGDSGFPGVWQDRTGSVGALWAGMGQVVAGEGWQRQ